MQLNPAAFDAHLNGIGQNFLWRRSFACACINPTSGAPKANCPHCRGKGQLWTSAVQARAGVASQKTQQEWARMGLWESGDAVISIPSDSPMYAMGKFDRVTMLNSTDPFSMPLIHGAPNERLLPVVQKIDRVFWFNGAGQVVEGGIPTVSDTGVLTWSTGEPPVGATYSITGTRFSEYYCFGQYASDRGEHGGALLPRRVVLRNFDLFGNRSGLSQTI